MQNVLPAPSVPNANADVPTAGQRRRVGIGGDVFSPCFGRPSRQHRLVRVEQQIVERLADLFGANRGGPEVIGKVEA